MNYQELPVHDFENDNTISDTRKKACKIDYPDMQLHHIDKIYSSAFVYDKKTGEPIAKKPRSIHELVYCLMKSAQALTEYTKTLEDRISLLEKQFESICG